MNKIICEGFVHRTRTRKCDLDKNPIEDWTDIYQSSWGGTVNPYVYTTAQRAGKINVGFRYMPIKDYDNALPYPNVRDFIGGYNSVEFREALMARNESIKTIGYYEQEQDILPARIVVDV